MVLGLSKLEPYKLAQSPSSIPQPKFSFSFAHISAGLGGLPGRVTQTFIPEVSELLVALSMVAQSLLSLS